MKLNPIYIVATSDESLLLNYFRYLGSSDREKLLKIAERQALEVEVGVANADTLERINEDVRKIMEDPT